MHIVLLIIHLLIVVSLITVIMIQQTASSGLGFGGDKDFLALRGSKNALTRATAILAACFFLFSLLITIVDNSTNSVNEVLHNLPNKNPSPSMQIGKPIEITIPEKKAAPAQVSQKTAAKQQAANSQKQNNQTKPQ